MEADIPGFILDLTYFLSSVLGQFLKFSGSQVNEVKYIYPMKGL